MPRIIHLIKDLDVGGIQTVLLDRLRFSRENDGDEGLVCMGSGEYQKEFEALGAFFIPKRLPYLDPLAVLKLRRFLLANKVEEVHAHHTSEGVAAWLATKGTGVKYIQYFHVHPMVSNRQDNAVLRFLAKRMDAGVSPTQAQKDALANAGYFTKKMRVEYNRVHPRRLRPNEKSLRQMLGIPSEARLILSIGNFYNDTRDQYTICRAFPEVLQQLPDVHVVFIGGITNRYTPHSPSYEKCYTFCEEQNLLARVHFPGVIDDAPSYLSQCDLFVYATLGDTFGMAVAEAMLAHVPVIANDHPVMREITGGHLPLYPTQNHQALSKLILAYFTQPEDYPMGKLREQARGFGG